MMDKNNNQEMFHKTSINWYPGHMAKTKRLISENINLIDIVYEVIDARMPYSSKLREVDTILKNKPRLIIMTKIDLCDISETNKWIKYYENLGNKVVKANLDSNFNIKPILKATEELMEKINAKRENKGMLKRKSRVVVVGIPNAGKSKLINKLVNKKVAGVGNKPGVTKQVSWIRISNDIELLDTPGILWPKLSEETVAFNLATFSAIKEEVLPIYDVANYVLNMLYKYYPNILKDKYGLLELDDDMYENFDIIGKRRGCLIKGGEIDYEKVVTIILNDIKSGTIKGITLDRFDEYEELIGNN